MAALTICEEVFGERWAKQLPMRHDHSEAMRFYFGSQADAMASAVWGACKASMQAVSPKWVPN